jgi:hypothetical protein
MIWAVPAVLLYVAVAVMAGWQAVHAVQEALPAAAAAPAPPASAALKGVAVQLAAVLLLCLLATEQQ